MGKIQRNLYFFAGLSVLCMGFIFYMSAQPGEASAASSNWSAGLLHRLLGTEFTDFLVRKLAHFLEYSALAFCLSGTFYAMKRASPGWVWALVCTSLYAATDELHQLFVPGRACQMRDWLIDTAGALCGVLLFIGLRLVWKQLCVRQAQRKKA